MTTEQILWSVIIFLLTCMIGLIGILYWTLRGDIKEVRDQIRERTLIIDCRKMHTDLDRYLHKHALVGTAGEVVDK